MTDIDFKDFQKVDIRIGTVVEAEVPQWSHWVMKLSVDFASEAKSAKDRTSRRVRIEPKSREVRSGGGSELYTKVCFSGIMKFFEVKDLIGKQFPFVVNLKPKTIGPEKELSEVMMLMATPDNPTSQTLHGASEETPPVLFKLSKKVPNGTSVA